jgi:hypothetical protein
VRHARRSGGGAGQPAADLCIHREVHLGANNGQLLRYDDVHDDFLMRVVIQCSIIGTRLRKRSWPRSNPYATWLNPVVRTSETEPVVKRHSEATKCALFVTTM